MFSITGRPVRIVRGCAFDYINKELNKKGERKIRRRGGRGDIYME